jgi:hypothetical protein
VDALGPARVARLLDGLRATLALADVPAARAASTSLAHLLGTALSRPGTDLAPWRPVLAALAPATLARLLHDTPLPDALLVPLARQVLTDPGGDAPGSGDDAVPALDHAAAALARRPAAAALALTGLDADAWRRLLGTPTDGGVAALLRTLAARDALTPSVAAGIVDPLIDVLRDEPDRPPPPTRAALGDVLGAWVDHLTAATTGIGAFAPRPVEDLHAALAAAARSAEGAEALTAWLVAVTREGLAPGGAGPVTSPLVLGLAADVVGSAVVAGRRAWAERRAEQRDDLTSLAHDVLSVPVGKLATLVARHPAAAPAVSYVQRVTTDWVVDRAADLVGLPDADEPARTRRRAEADRERLALVLAVDALALGGASPALVAAARAARTRTELVAVLDRRRADVPPVVLEYLAGLAGCDRRVCR